MSAFAEIPYFTPQEYLERDHIAEYKSEYFDGSIVAMSGASPDHDRVAVNILANLHAQLSGKSCEPFTSNMRVSVPACNRYYYPDVTVACDDLQFESISGVKSLQNPVVVFEVLSDSTERTDRGEKLICYQTIPSLEVYAIVSQKTPLVQVYERQSDDSWRYSLHQGVDATLSFPAIDCRLRLADIYARVSFRNSEESESGPMGPDAQLPGS